MVLSYAFAAESARSARRTASPGAARRTRQVRVIELREVKRAETEPSPRVEVELRRPVGAFRPREEPAVARLDHEVVVAVARRPRPQCLPCGQLALLPRTVRRGPADVPVRGAIPAVEDIDVPVTPVVPRSYVRGTIPLVPVW